MSKTLHTLNTSPSDSSTLAQCLATLSDDDVLLLIEDGVYLTLPAHRDKLPDTVKLHALAVDLEARGIQETGKIIAITDPEFVNLTLSCDRVVSWF
ncbi:sulfurtransferase complex subunit TusB [Nitrincola iocasae]|jgi:sulfur relay protein TusB/DsrH|uniref:Sulfurtransferase complex subunit TusB n=1 Tax=Nitrincola iocasae TaxID=2614693 RepID=A0A5J6LEJ6_9GAMM|nr:sulfurtransferase complex subunit TusB [Nitrincola iocasae]QEW06591.1 sulfurtransferase complex subunit TusB [Nitrincola iocasae]